MLHTRIAAGLLRFPLRLTFLPGHAGDVAGARDQFAALLPVRKKVLGAKDPDTLTTQRELARWTGEAGNAAAAQEQLTTLLPIVKKVLGAKHPDTLTTQRQRDYWTSKTSRRDVD